MRATVVAIYAGKPKRMGIKDASDPMEREWYSGIYKKPVNGPVWMGYENIDGDGQADHRFHGGPNRVALCYSADHYARWQTELNDPSIVFGSFGENFTVEGLEESTVHMDDIYRIGEARVQVSQLRGPCWKLARRIGHSDIVERVLENGRSGWYVRVLQEGHVEAGQPLILEDRLDGSPSMLEVHASKHWK